MFGVVNGRCVEDPRSKASDLSSNSLLGLDIATNRDIIGIALANLIVSSSPMVHLVRGEIFLPRLKKNAEKVFFFLFFLFLLLSISGNLLLFNVWNFKQ